MLKSKIMNKLSLQIIFSIFLCELTVIGQNNSTGFQKEYSITCKEIMSEYIDIEYLKLADTLIIAKLFSEEDYYYAVYAPSTLTEIMRIARIGNGPGEFSNGLSYYGQYTLDNNRIKIWVKGTNSNKLSLIDVSESINQNKTIVEDVIKLSPETEYSTVFYIDSTKVVGRSYNSTPNMNRLQIFNPKENTIVKTIPLFPEVKNDNQNLQFIFYRYNFLYVSSLTMKYDKTRFASAMNMFNRLDIFDANGNLLNSYIDKDNISKSQIRDYLSSTEQNLINLDVKNYYMNACSTNDFIYTLYYNQKQADYPRKSIPITIRVFNWNAEPVCFIKVPDYLTSFSIDEKNGIIYGVAYHDEKILKYDIKSILDEIKK